MSAIRLVPCFIKPEDIHICVIAGMSHWDTGYYLYGNPEFRAIPAWNNRQHIAGCWVDCWMDDYSSAPAK